VIRTLSARTASSCRPMVPPPCGPRNCVGAMSKRPCARSAAAAREPARALDQPPPPANHAARSISRRHPRTTPRARPKSGGHRGVHGAEAWLPFRSARSERCRFGPPSSHLPVAWRPKWRQVRRLADARPQPRLRLWSHVRAYPRRKER
jgi:hypothetical protein